MRFVFWNQNRKSLVDLSTAIAREHRVDVLLLAECGCDPDELRIRLGEVTGRAWWHHASPVPERGALRVFSSQTASAFREIRGDSQGRLSVRVFQYEHREVLLALLHISSKLHARETSQLLESVDIVDTLRMIEEERGHRRTIVVGDFNMNPFEDGLVASRGFNAVSTRRRAAKGARIVQGRTHPLFYNPMWNLFGDETPGPAGTFFRSVSEHAGIDWNMFDQVLVSPELLPKFSRALQILTRAGDQDLLTRHGRPNQRTASDHLPILFAID